MACALAYISLVGSFEEVLLGVPMIGVSCGCRKVSIADGVAMLEVAQHQ